jgi:hypothetical protein
VVIAQPSASFRAFSAKEFQPFPPGPMAQAFTFRAFGAETAGDTVSKSLGYFQSSAIARLERLSYTSSFDWLFLYENKKKNKHDCAYHGNE